MAGTGGAEPGGEAIGGSGGGGVRHGREARPPLVGPLLGSFCAFCTLCDALHREKLPPADIDARAAKLLAWLDGNFQFQVAEPDGGDPGFWRSLVGESATRQNEPRMRKWTFTTLFEMATPSPRVRGLLAREAARPFRLPF